MRIFLLILLLPFCLFAITIGENPDMPNKLPDTLLGYKVSTGAASGYIEDLACKTCHPKHWSGYQEVGMSQSFSKPEVSKYIENFDAEVYYHQQSQRYYKIEKVSDDLFFKRYQLDENGEKINQFTRKVDWILGSGNKARSYLYQNPSGEIYQFPLGWYSDTQQWRMSPGFERNNEFGIQRIVRRECLFCHNAFPQVPKGSDSHWQPHSFPKELPHGTGCQRCHGPGARHIQTILNGGSLEQIHKAIVNPAKLPIKERDSVCFQCHMLPSVSMIGIRNIDRDDYSFRPGELISDYIKHIEYIDPQLPKSERFEINHHAYRLTQSECFIKSAGKLTCISCHNPHKKIKAAEKINHYGSICLNCHKKHSIKTTEDIDANDCTSCHMPQRRTQDVIEVVMTDHKIQKIAAPKSQRLAPIIRKNPIIEQIDLLIKEPSLTTILEDIYTTIPILRSVTSAKYIEYYKKLLSQSDSLNPLFYIDLASGQLNLKHYSAALESLEKILIKQPNNLKALQLTGVALIGLKQYSKSKTTLETALKINPNSAETHFNLALMFISTDDYPSAKKSLKSAIELSPTLTSAWYYSAYINEHEKNYSQAIDNYKTVLEIDPSHSRAYLNIAKAFMQLNNQTEAIRYLKHGIKVAENNSQLTDLLIKISPIP